MLFTKKIRFPAWSLFFIGSVMLLIGCNDKPTRIDFEEKFITPNVFFEALNTLEILSDEIKDTTVVFYKTPLTRDAKAMINNLPNYYARSCDKPNEAKLIELLGTKTSDDGFDIKEGAFSGNYLKIREVNSNYDFYLEKRVELSDVVIDSAQNKALFYIGFKCMTSDCNYSTGAVFIYRRKNNQWVLENHLNLWDTLYPRNLFNEDSLEKRNFKICD